MSIDREKSILCRACAGVKRVLRGFVQLSYRSSRAWTAFLS
jgi:hypothetical protein